MTIAVFGQTRFFLHIAPLFMLSRVESGHGAPLLGLNVIVQHTQLGEQLNDAGFANPVDADKQVVWVSRAACC